MTKLISSVVAFAAGDTSLFDMTLDYWNHFRSDNGKKKFAYSETDANGKAISFVEKEVALNAAMKREISKRSGIDLTVTPIEQAFNHPMVVWAATNIVSQMIDAILPQTMIDSVGAFSEVRNVGFGETALFDISSRDLFPVSRSGHMGMREGEIHMGFNGQVALNPEQRTMTVGVSLYRMLIGLDNFSTFVLKSLRSIESAVTRDIYDATATAFAALSTGTNGLRVVGYTQKDLVQLAQKVQAYSGGATPIVIGTKVALAQVLPDDTNYRYMLESPYVQLGYLRTISGIDTLELPQVAKWESPFSTYLNDDRLWIIAPGTDRPVKLVLGGASMSNTSGTFDAATLIQTTTIYKAWKAGLVTSSVVGQITLN